MSELVPTDDNAITPGGLMRALTELARDEHFDVDKFKVLADLQLRMEDRQAERMLTRDLAAIKKRLPPVERDGTISLGQGKGSIPFASYEAVMGVVQPMLNEFDMSISFTSRFEHEKVIVTAILRHPAGASISADVPLPIDTGPGRNSTQAHGSSIQYGRRYAVEELFNIIRKGKDDDGSTADLRFISGEQCREIEELIQKSGRSRDAFLRWAEVQDVTEIEVQRFTATKNALLKAVAQKEKEAAQ